MTSRLTNDNLILILDYLVCESVDIVVCKNYLLTLNPILWHALLNTSINNRPTGEKRVVIIKLWHYVTIWKVRRS